MVLAFVTSAIFFVGTGVSTNVCGWVIQCTEDDVSVHNRMIL